MNRFALLALLPLALAAPLAAQDDPYDTCAAMAGDTERLTCFDTVHAQRSASRGERAAAEQAENFGLSASDRREPARSDVAQAEDEAEEPEFTLSATVTEAFIDGLSKRVLLLDNGQLWRETTGSTMRGSPPSAGSQASISESWSGAYQMRIDGRRGYIRVSRIR